eukprot:2370207-Pyramimonas_sp.AAC.1
MEPLKDLAFATTREMPLGVKWHGVEELTGLPLEPRSDPLRLRNSNIHTDLLVRACILCGLSKVQRTQPSTAHSDGRDVTLITPNSPDTQEKRVKHKQDPCALSWEWFAPQNVPGIGPMTESRMIECGLNSVEALQKVFAEQQKEEQMMMEFLKSLTYAPSGARPTPAGTFTLHIIRRGLLLGVCLVRSTYSRSLRYRFATLGNLISRYRFTILGNFGVDSPFRMTRPQPLGRSVHPHQMTRRIPSLGSKPTSRPDNTGVFLRDKRAPSL